jgi:hypothetical protein
MFRDLFAFDYSKVLLENDSEKRGINDEWVLEQVLKEFSR